jgi:hypothetical protein
LKTWLDVFDIVKKQADRKLKITLSDLLEGKAMEEEYTPLEYTDNNTGEKGKVKGLPSNMEIIPDDEAASVNYEEDEYGNEVAVYKKRETAPIPIQSFEQEYGSQMFCDTCYVRDQCPKFQAAHNCAYDFKVPEKIATPFDLVNFLIELQSQRVMKGMMIENFDGGQPSKTLTSEMNFLNNLNAQRTNMMVMAQSRGVKLNVKSGNTEMQIDLTGDSKENEKEESSGFKDLLVSMMKNKSKE